MRKVSWLTIVSSGLPILLSVSGLQAVPVYPVTAGTISYVNNYLGSGLGDSFNFTGPMVSIAGSGATAVAYSNLPMLNVPFSFSLPIAIDDTGDESGPAMANGVNYPSVQYVNGSSAIVSALSNVTLTSGHLTVAVPGQITGSLMVCNPANICAFGGGVPMHVFDASFNLSGTLTLTFAEFNLGSTYTLTNASFTTSTVPEPGSWAYVALGWIAVCVARQAARRMT